MQKRIRQVGTLAARGSSGRLVNLSLFQEFLDAGTKDDPNAERKGTTQIMTADGRCVTRVSKGKYRIAGSAEILASDDPTAP